MEAISYTAVRNNLAKTMDQVSDTHEPVIITRQKGASVVLMSLEDFNAYQETAYLMRSPKNAERLNRAIRQIESGRAKPRKLRLDSARMALAMSTPATTSMTETTLGATWRSMMRPCEAPSTRAALT